MKKEVEKRGEGDLPGEEGGMATQREKWEGGRKENNAKNVWKSHTEFYYFYAFLKLYHICNTYISI